jgi:A/G-specific adenine glycosylase
VPAAVRSSSLAAVRRHLLVWYEADHRELPFRRSREPWPVLVAEVMLQQTQASRIAERFDAFLARYPCPQVMAATPAAQVLADWSGFGYNRRGLNLHAAATRIAADGWPRTVQGLDQLPGIGPYSARAIASIAFDQPVGAVDTNVRRWLVRRFGISADDRHALQDAADRLAAVGNEVPGEAGTWTHATMEFGARICSARAPHCAVCPIARGCPSRQAPPRVPVPRATRSTAGQRAARGVLLRALVGAPGHRLSEARARSALSGRGGKEPVPAYESVRDGLERDGLVHRTGRSLLLGPSPGS